jgi:hypothetical protein
VKAEDRENESDVSRINFANERNMHSTFVASINKTVEFRSLGDRGNFTC